MSTWLWVGLGVYLAIALWVSVEVGSFVAWLLFKLFWPLTVLYCLYLYEQGKASMTITMHKSKKKRTFHK